MGRFEGLVPQAVPDTVTVQSGNPAPRTSLMAAFALRAAHEHAAHEHAIDA